MEAAFALTGPFAVSESGNPAGSDVGEVSVLVKADRLADKRLGHAEVLGELPCGRVAVGHRAREALKKWSRYLWENGTYTGHIMRIFSYNTTDQAELCARALEPLKRQREIQVNYEIELRGLPENVRVGDTESIVDSDGALYLSARVLRLESSAADDVHTATLGDYLIRDDGIADRPEGLAAGGILVNYNNFSGGSKAQYLYSADGQMYCRVGTNAFKEIPYGSFRYCGEIAGGAFADYRAEGYYRFSQNDVESISDRPEGLAAGGILVNYNNFSGGSRAQYLYTADGRMYCRVGTNAFRGLVPQREVRYYALGDSITEGSCSENGKIGPVIADNYVKILAESNGYKLTNYGEGGSGWNHAATFHNHYNAKQLVDAIDFSGAELVTIAYGVNDWKYNERLGTFEDDIATGGTLYSNMRYVIEKILRDNPCCKIFVITPLNSAKYGNEAANYGIGYPFSNNGTLEDIFQAEKRVAEYYGVGLIDMTHDSIVNRRNIAAVLPDKVHPSLSAHDLIARELAEKITFR